MSRYYDPTIGQFISPDSFDYLDSESLTGVNLYAYCGNDPVNYYDPYGHFAIIIGASIVIGGAELMAIFKVAIITVITIGVASLENEYHFIENGINAIADSISSFIDGSIQYIKKKTYGRKKAAPRIKKKNKKDAKQAAFLKGGKKELIFHKGKHGRHFHPNNPKYKHWHYYWMLLLGLMYEEEEEHEYYNDWIYEYIYF